MSMFTSSDAACEAVQRSFDPYVSDELDAAYEQTVRQHLDTCHVCAEMVDERVRVKHLIQRAVRREVAGEALRRRIQKLIREN